MRDAIQVLVTMPFTDAQLDRLRAVSPRLAVSRADVGTADYARTNVLYAVAPPRDLARAPDLRWVQLHMAGVNTFYDHPLFATSDLPITTTSGVHAATIAEYAITVLLALAHRVPRMVDTWSPSASGRARATARRSSTATSSRCTSTWTCSRRRGSMPTSSA